jgi:alkylation response protein AidB-like acyl-CoA dehydrogenase
VDFELADEERALGRAIATLCAGLFPLDGVRAAEGAPDVVDRSGWSELAEAGVFSLLVSEEEGGLGLGLAHTAVVFEELGRALVPGPMVASTLAARFVSGADDGSVVVGATRRPRRGGSALVDHYGSLDALVVIGDEGPSVGLVDPGSLRAEVVADPLDPLTPVWLVSELPAGRQVQDDGATADGDDLARRWIREEEVLTGALCVGIAAATLDLAVAYAKERQQFGTVIGSFQAVKHLCADMLVRSESARAAVQAAAVTADQPDVGDPARAAAGAALVATEAAVANAKTCIQVHGGMGFTWELPLHLYLMRAKVLAATLRSPAALSADVAARY